MDSFFSLFDPSDGQSKPEKKKRQKPDQDTVKKKTDAPKGRRRGRKSNNKNETLPEESSFLCEPELGTEMLVKDVSYIENFIEINKREDDQKQDDKKAKRRCAARKTRRKKYKSKDNRPEDLNNQKNTKKINDDSVGKNVNDLKSQRFDEDFNTVYNVIDKLEKVSLKDDRFLAGDVTADDLENDFFYCSDDDEEYVEYSTSEPEEDSGDESYGSLPPEPRFGNVEYKLQLVPLCERRFQHLVTQLKWRLSSGGGSCVYVVGVRDCGALVGLRARQLRASLHALRRMAAALGATLVHVAARRVTHQRAVAEVYIRKLADPQQSVELRVAVMGANEAGKSTLIGVLTQGELDNGRGSARLNMFRHLHEVKSGRTSSLSHEILGFDAQGNVVNYGCSELMTAERIGERSAKLVSFLDLAGHTKYQRTTLHGLTGYSPHYAMLVISATAGVTRITEEHTSLLLALDLPFFAVITKCELAPGAVPALRDRLAALLESSRKKPVLITDENAARSCVAPQRLILDSLNQDGEKEEEECTEQVPVFPVSCVRGNGLNALHAYLLAIPPPQHHAPPAADEETCEFQIDEIFHVGESSGPVVGGLVVKGQIREGDQLIMGPLEDGSFSSTVVRSVHRNRAACRAARAGHCCSVGLAAGAPRPGMVLLAPRAAAPPRLYGACAHRCLTRKKLEADKQSQVNENTSPPEKVGLNSLTPEPERADEECICPDRVYLEEPGNPRGCLFFQASVHLLRHSTAIYPGFQCVVHVGNVRQTAIIEGIMCRNGVVRAGENASVVFRFVRCPEYLVSGRRMLFTAGLGTRAVGRITQTFPHIP
ncbi:GTP-binding protein 2 [Manduca sexta]|uniref:Tr-type G domain-containing protein n=1 Tax=Manduca sexta TaxID=7130 RepID=A0A922CXJ5_MANSE|nr:GTP-binding protein 2 [Manduca sexta]KAG6461586.1 hypothetical protein O3G_MSEX012719 [Manduca sexta]